jgi:hypothetical protein
MSCRGSSTCAGLAGAARNSTGDDAAEDAAEDAAVEDAA